MLADERDATEEKLHREEEPHERVVIAIDCRERRNWGASLAISILRFHVDLVWREKPLRCFILATRVNNVSYECYVIFVSNITFVMIQKTLVTGNYFFASII